MFYHMCSGNSDEETSNGGKLDFRVEGYAFTSDQPSSLLDQGFSHALLTSGRESRTIKHP